MQSNSVELIRGPGDLMRSFQYATIILVLMGMKIVGFIVIFGNYPSEKSFLLSTMDIYHNDELMTPCDEVSFP